jgi:hypothetical protein
MVTRAKIYPTSNYSVNPHPTLNLLQAVCGSHIFFTLALENARAMPAINKKLMAAFTMRIAVEDLKKKELAAELEIGPRRFGEMLESQREMPLAAREKLLDLLDLEDVWKRLNR